MFNFLKLLKKLNILIIDSGNKTSETHVHTTKKGVTIIVDGKTIDPKSAEGKRILKKVEKAKVYTHTQMKKLAKAVERMNKDLEDAFK